MNALAPHTAATLRLPAVMDLTAAAPLAAELLALRRRPLRIDASAVTSVGALCLQVLLSTRLTWKADSTELAFVDLSPAFIEHAALLGASGLLDLDRKIGS